MASEPSYLIDTNVLLRLSKQDDPNHGMVHAAIDALTKRGTQLCYTAQNISEFWNVRTRPASHNGFGLSIHKRFIPDCGKALLFHHCRSELCLTHVRSLQIDSRWKADCRGLLN